MTDTFHETASQCPGCGAELRWKVGQSRVIVCDYCHYASVRDEAGLLEKIGRIADPVPTGARLTIGATGKLDGTGFRLVGRLQLSWAQGAWDEWYAAFDDGRWAWVSEAQGRYFLTTRVSGHALPPLSALRPGRELSLEKLGRYVVTDVREASYSGAKGELPEPILLDGSKVHLVDLEGKQGGFATLDFSDAKEPAAYAGREVTFDELHVQVDGVAVPPEAPRAKAAALKCESCGAPVELKVPDLTLRATCSSCGALLDFSKGAAAVVSALGKQQRKHKFRLGQDVTFGGTKYLFIGWVERACKIDGERFTWEEYLLYDPRTAAFRYLVCSDGHWSFVVPIGAGDVHVGSGRVEWRGRSFKHFASVRASVSAVLGEFPWAVAIGETAIATDYVLPPEGLSEERSESEVVWSHATYVEPEAVWKAFGSDKPRAANGVGMLQPNPHEQSAKRAVPAFLLAFVALVVLLFVQVARSHGEVVLERQIALAEGEGVDPAAPPEQYATSVHFTDPFELVHDDRNLKVRLTSDVVNGWVFVGFGLVNEDTNEVTEFSLESSYYSGTDSDGAWTENDRESNAYLSAPRKGRYVLRTEAQWERGKPPPTIQVELRSGAVRGLHFVLALLAILVPFAWLWIRRSSFEQSRWENAGDGL